MEGGLGSHGEVDEVLQNLFKSLLNAKDRAASPGVSPCWYDSYGYCECGGKWEDTGMPRASSGSARVGASGGESSETDPDERSGKEGAREGGYCRMEQRTCYQPAGRRSFLSVVRVTVDS